MYEMKFAGLNKIEFVQHALLFYDKLTLRNLIKLNSGCM